MKLTPHPSPNFDERHAEIDMLILHYTGMQSGKEAIERLCDREAKVSAHYVVEENGDVYQLVDEASRAWHAGISFWRGQHHLNANSIGIEIVNPGHEFGYREFTQAQYNSIIELAATIKEAYNIPNINIVAHSDVAPERKTDPGELFNWKLLAETGIGLWPKQTSDYQNFRFTEDNLSQTVLTHPQLIHLGYQNHDEHSITAFQRHWRQHLVNGIWDDECEKTLLSLLQHVS